MHDCAYFLVALTKFDASDMLSYAFQYVIVHF